MSELPSSEHRCPHCDSQLEEFEIPNELAWGDATQLACFNDDCSYFKEGWDWMWEQYRAKASYRYRLCPYSGKVTPLAVWSNEALRDRIIKREN